MKIQSDKSPWDYLNGTEIEFKIDGGAAQGDLVALYNFLCVMGLGISVVLILAAIVEIVYTSSAQNRAQRKQVLTKRVGTMLAIGMATSFLTLLMTLCNILFGVS